MIRTFSALPYALVYEDDAIFAIAKPAGIHSVRHGEEPGDSVADALLALEPNLAGVATSPGDAGLAQRLDFETSGVMVGAKAATYWESLREGTSDKRYLALVEGVIDEILTIEGYIGGRHRNSTRVVLSPHPVARARPAFTRVFPLCVNEKENLSLVSVEIDAGRRHQIRVSLSAKKRPLAGDSLYGSARKLNQILRTDRGFLLHAHAVTVEHPVSGTRIEIAAPLESELEAQLSTLFPDFESTSGETVSNTSAFSPSSNS